MGISIPAAWDFLFSLAQTSTAGLVVGGAPVFVSDGWPVGKAKGNLVLGLAEPPEDGDSGETASQGSRTWLTLGVNNTQENYTIPCYVMVWSGGADQQSQTRLDAAAIFDAFAHAINVDPSLGGGPTFDPVTRAVMQAQVVDINLAPSITGAAAQQGRRTVISFGVACMNVYQP